jgi:aldehyde:ferredoxin oxidoreductase
LWPYFYTPNSADYGGPTPEGEPKYFNAVTGKNISFVDGMEIGRRIWNMARSIWILQGRHRNMEVFTGYVYDVPISSPYYLPVYENGRWKYSDNMGRKLDRARFEDWKTLFYKFEGWDPDNGWPTRETLEELNLSHVADTLEKAGRLGTTN